MKFAAAAFALLSVQAFAFDLQGHRGARALVPENSMASFSKALAIGVTTLETDIAVTSDGVLVIHHDQELFALVRQPGNEHVRLALETKVNPVEPGNTLEAGEFATKLVAAIKKAGLEKRTAIISFDWRTLQVVQKLAPEIATTYITARQSWLDTIKSKEGGVSPWVAGFQFKEHGSVPRMIKAAGGKTWSSYFNDLDRSQVKEAQSLGIQVLAWTVNKPEDIARVMDLGVDGIVSDRPDLVLAEMERRGMKLPPKT